MTPQEVIHLIKNAWLEAQCPSPDDLLPSNIIGDEEQMGVRRAFSGRKWDKLDSSFLDNAPEGWASALSFMSGAARRYFIGAYMIAELQGELKRVDVGFSLTYGFDGAAYGQRSPTIDQQQAREWLGLSQEQIEAIVQFLRWRAEDEIDGDFAAAALDLYWLPRANGARPELHRNIV